jgi:hypothetical protein
MMLMMLAAAQIVSPASSDGACVYDKGEYVPQEQLPAAIGTDLWTRAPGLSPQGGPFQATDVGEGPRARFMTAARLGNRYVVAYERGGRGYNIQVLTYTVASNGLASLANQRTAFEKPACNVIAAALVAP